MNSTPLLKAPRPTDTTVSRPRLYWLVGLMLTAFILATVFVWWNSGGSFVPGIGGPFTLEDGTGKTVTDRDFRGKYMLVYFGYTFCPDVCPTTLNEVAEAMDRLGPKAEKIQPIFITVDPNRDTPAVVKQYANAFTPRLLGLTGTSDQIAKVANEYRVYYAKHRTGPGPNDYSMDHSSVLYLMGPDATFIAPIRTDQSGPEIADEIARLVK